MTAVLYLVVACMWHVNAWIAYSRNDVPMLAASLAISWGLMVPIYRSIRALGHENCEPTE